MLRSDLWRSFICSRKNNLNQFYAACIHYNIHMLLHIAFINQEAYISFLD